jgi:hypothetical protein
MRIKLVSAFRGMLWCFVLLSFLGGGVALAAEAVGWVQEVQGTVTVISGGASTPAAVGGGVKSQDSLKTGPASRVQVMFKDKTTLALSENSECLMADVYMEKGQSPRFMVKLLNGAMGVLTGAIATINPEAFKVDTPLVALGIRGTEFASAVDPSKEVHGLYAGGPVIVKANTPPQKAGAPALQGEQKEDLCDQIRATVKRLNLAYMSKRGAGRHSEGKELKAEAEEYEKLLGKYQCK